MFGLYLHIPFCARRCPYCDFAIIAGAKNDFVQDYVAALHQEIVTTARDASLRARALTSIYFGGGTPSFLDGEVLASLLTAIKQNFAVTDDAEITLEANPEDATAPKLSTLRAAGWNRISFGAQSFSPDELKFLGRRHDEQQIEYSIEAARAAGFTNFNLDLIYGLPHQSRAAWQSTLARAVDLQVPHLSCYSLTIENGTNFGARAQRGVLVPATDDAQATLMQDAQEILESAGLERYEISNYARAGFQSRHNLNYWRGGDYLALGNGAHGHRNGKRWWNERDPRKYVQQINEQGSAIAGDEVLTPRERLDELVMLGLRMRAGFNLETVSALTGLNARLEMNGTLGKLLDAGVLEQRGDEVRVSAEAMPLADGIAARLLA